MIIYFGPAFIISFRIDSDRLASFPGSYWSGVTPRRSLGILRFNPVGITKKVRLRLSAPINNPNSKRTLSRGASASLPREKTLSSGPSTRIAKSDQPKPQVRQALVCRSIETQSNEKTPTRLRARRASKCIHRFFARLSSRLREPFSVCRR